MAILDLLIYPDPRLRLPTQPVDQFDKILNTLLDNMLKTMYAHKGIGLAAPQVGVASRIFVVDVSETRDQPLVFVNPKWITRTGAFEYEEGCLSVPGYYASIMRAQSITIQAQDRSGQSFELKAEGLLSTCIQHEYDHLEGLLFIDYLSRLKKSRVEKKVKKYLCEKAKP